MDLIELRLLAVGGILAVGIVMSALGCWPRRSSNGPANFLARTGRASGQRAVRPRPDLGAGRARW